MPRKTPRLGPHPSIADHEQRTVRLRFDAFGWQSAEALATRQGVDLEEWIGQCCLAYADRHGSDALSLQPPRFKHSEGETRKLRITLPSATWASLDRASLGFDLERLVEHATISHAAREQEWIQPSPQVELQREPPPAGAPAGEGGRRLAAIGLIFAGILLVPVTLAAAGVSLPAPVGSAFERVGIELPNQPQGPPPPVVLKDPRRRHHASAPGAEVERAIGTQAAVPGGKRPRPDRGKDERLGSFAEEPTTTEVPPVAIVPPAPEVVPEAPAEPAVPAEPDPPPPEDEEDGIEERETGPVDDPLGVS